MVEIDKSTNIRFEDNKSIAVSINESNSHITLTWEGVNIYLPEQKKGLFSGNSSPAKSIIQNVEGIAKPGQLLAIMGASGAGKTTLLNAMTFRSNGNLLGDSIVKVNGKVIDSSDALAEISGYVQQDDIFIGTLSVKEHLKFQAMLRMKKGTSNAERRRRVDEVLNDLNLEKCKDTLIGDPLLSVKGISGGERRRLAFASEIITNPGLLFCDEPTSGLDSFMAMTIVESMKHLAEQGKTIVCTIHQPSSEIFRNFDNLYLMAEGRLAYSGPLKDAISFFQMQGYKCPANYNPADFYINKLAISPFDKEKSLETVKYICDGFEKSSYSQNLKDEINLSNQKTGFEGLQLTGYKTHTLNQLKWLVWRDGLAALRNPMETKILILQTIVIAVMFGLIYFQLDLDQNGVQNINGVLFLLVTNSSFSNLFPILNSFTPMVPLFLRENKNKMYRVLNFYISKMIIDLPKFIIIPILFTTIVYWMADLNNEFEKFAITCGTIIIASFTAASMGLLIATVAPTLNIALALAPSILVPLMIFSGFFLNNDSVPVYFYWAKYLSWLQYANEILVVNQWDDITSIACNQTRCITNGTMVIDIMSVKPANFNWDFLWIGCLIVGFRSLAFLSLLRKSYKK